MPGNNSTASIKMYENSFNTTICSTINPDLQLPFWEEMDNSWTNHYKPFPHSNIISWWSFLCLNLGDTNFEKKQKTTDRKHRLVKITTRSYTHLAWPESQQGWLAAACGFLHRRNSRVSSLLHGPDTLCDVDTSHILHHVWNFADNVHDFAS